jgi:hypothetical protein
VNEGEQEFGLAADSPLIDAGGALAEPVLPGHAVRSQYVIHQRGSPRPDDGKPDLGALEYEPGGPPT